MATSPMPVPTGGTINLPGQTGGAVPMAPATPAIPSTTAAAVPTTASNTGVGAVGNQLTDIYGATGGAINNLLNSETPGTANSTAQAIITANNPNVAQERANLNTNLAAAGISPSSSVAAIENANFSSGVAQQDASLLAQTNMQEQQMQQNLLESIAPSAQQQTTDSSGWGIFNNVMTGLGDVGGAIAEGVTGVGGLIPSMASSGSGNPLGIAADSTGKTMSEGGIPLESSIYSGGL